MLLIYFFILIEIKLEKKRKFRDTRKIETTNSKRAQTLTAVRTKELGVGWFALSGDHIQSN